MTINQLIFGAATLVVWAALPRTFRNAFIAPEGRAGLLFHRGRFVGLCGPGRHALRAIRRTPRE